MNQFKRGVIMNDKYLVVNAGSSSLKFSLYENATSNPKEIVNGYVERIGSEDSLYTLKYQQKKVKKDAVIMNHTDAVEVMIQELLEHHFIEDVNEIKGVGHRVLHGAELYQDSVVIDDKVLRDIKNFTKLGPLHHPGEIAGIENMQEYIPEAIQVAVFDTSFHQSIPRENYLYAVPYEWYTKYGVRKYGFHGTSHKYITETMQTHYGKSDVNLIICHIGSGASISCIKDGVCYDTTMGLTPLDGLIMGTRSGSIDPSIIEYMCHEKHMTVEEMTLILNEQSGLIGLSGKNDFRDIEALANASDEQAKLTIRMLRNSIIRYIAQYYFELDGNVDAIIFTAGMGENAISLRADIINKIAPVLNVELDVVANENIASFKEYQFGQITTANSAIDIMVVPTNEEYMILRDTVSLCQKLKETSYQKKLK